MTDDDFLNEHLRIWKNSGVPAPLNELQSIDAWLRYLGEHGQEKTIETMQLRMMLLQDAAEKLHAQGPEAEDAAGIWHAHGGLRRS